MTQPTKIDSSYVQLWETYQTSLAVNAPNVVQFCNAEEHSIEKRAALAASIILNANCFKLGIGGGACCFARNPALVANRVRIENSQKLKDKCGNALPSADQLIDLMKKEGDEKTYLELVQGVDDNLLAGIVAMQSAIIGIRAREGSTYSDQDLQRLSSLLKLWPHSLADNQAFQEGFKEFWGSVLHFALNDVRRAANPDLILSFLESNPNLFSQKEVVEILKIGIKACEKEIAEITKHNQMVANIKPLIPTGHAILERIQAYIVKNNLEKYFDFLS